MESLNSVSTFSGSLTFGSTSIAFIPIALLNVRKKNSEIANLLTTATCSHYPTTTFIPPPIAAVRTPRVTTHVSRIVHGSTVNTNQNRLSHTWVVAVFVHRKEIARASSRLLHFEPHAARAFKLRHLQIEDYKIFDHGKAEVNGKE